MEDGGQTESSARSSDALLNLAGLSLSRIGAAGDMLWLQFGPLRMLESRKGPAREVGDWALHLQCPWRITRNEQIFFGNSDFYYDPQGQPLDERRELNLFTHKAAAFNQQLARHTPSVTKVSLLPAGAFHLHIGDNLCLSVLPTESQEIEDRESWRLFQPGLQAPHIAYPQ